MREDREYSPTRFAIASVACPSCHVKLEPDAKWCGTCGFTGEKSLEMFGEDPPPLLPFLDVADLFNSKEQKKIESAVAAFNKRFPQVNWRICAVTLDPDVNLSVFGFWLMNVCPLMPGETPEDREWTILLLIDGNSGRASVTTGYAAEVWLSDETWDRALGEMVRPFLSGQPEKAVVLFLQKTQSFFESAWKRSQKQLQHSSAK